MLVLRRRVRCGGGGGGFRVSVDLRQWFPAGDPRARAFLWVPGGGARPVRWLLQRARAALGLRGPAVLSARGHLLPPQEPLALLRAGDTVRVIPVTESQAMDCDRPIAAEERSESRWTVPGDRTIPGGEMISPETGDDSRGTTELDAEIESDQIIEGDGRERDERPERNMDVGNSVLHESPEEESPGALERLRGRALALLRRYDAAPAPEHPAPAPEHPAPEHAISASPSPQPLRRARRRVRRRPRARPAPGASAGEAEAACLESGAAGTACLEAGAACLEAGAACLEAVGARSPARVQRNASLPRLAAARRVHALA